MMTETNDDPEAGRAAAEALEDFAPPAGDDDRAEDAARALATAGDFGPATQDAASRRAVLGVPIEVVISVGRARPLLCDLVELRRDSVLSLDSRIEDPVEIMVGGRVIARGELQEIDGEGRLGVRLTEVADSMSAR